MAGNILIKNANGKTVTLQNPDTNVSDVTVDTSKIAISDGANSFNGFGGSGMKNYIINGNFDIWQYKDAGLTYPQTSNGYGSDDRWYNFGNFTTFSHSRIDCTDTERALFNASYFSRTIVSSVAGAANYFYKQQRIENVTKLAGKTVTLSFWAKADSAKNIALMLEQNFGTGGSPSSYVRPIGQQLISLTTTWQKKTITLTIPSIVGKTLGTDGVHTTSTDIIFWYDAGSNYNSWTNSLGQQSGTFDIAQVQLEEGSVATPFENRPFGLELSLCQRYYFAKLYAAMNISLVKAGGTWQSTSYKFPVTMRVAPTVVINATYQGDWTGLGSYSTKDEYRLSSNNSNAGSAEIATLTASAEL